MVAVCPQCQMRYEVSEELLAQASPVLCPTCQVPLEMEQPQPATEAAGQAEPTEGAAPAADPSAPPDPSADLDLGGWGQGDAQSDGWGTAPTWDDPGQGTEGQAVQPPDQAPVAQPPVEPADASTPEEGAGEDKPELITEPEGPKNSWDAGELLWGDSSEGTDTGDQPVAEAPPVEQAAEMPAAPPVEQAAVAQEPPAEPEGAAAQPAADVQAAVDVPAPVEVPGAVEVPSATPTAVEPPTAPPAAAEASAAAPAVDAPVAPPGAEAQADVTSAPTPGMDDWASAAAQWAASGFSTDSMPAFVKGQDDVPPEGQDPAGAVAPDQQAAQQPAPDTGTQAPAQAAAPPAPAVQDEPPPAELPEDALEPLPVEPQQPAPAAPPPLPNQQKKPIELPTPAASPPPLNGQRRSSYVMKGSGEGVKEEMPPWMGDSEPPPGDQQPSTVASMAVPTQVPTDGVQPAAPAQAPVVPAATPAPKKSSPLGKILIVLAVLALVGAGGYAAWYFYQASQKVIEDSPGLSGGPTTPVEKVDAGVAEPPVTDAGSPDKGPEKGLKKGPDKKPDKKPDKPKGPAVDKKPPKSDGEDKPKSKSPGAKSTKRMRELAVTHVNKGNALLRKKRYKEAIRFFRKALKADKAVSQAHRGLGVAYAQRGENQKACREYGIYLKSLPPGHKEIPTLKAILEKCK